MIFFWHNSATTWPQQHITSRFVWLYKAQHHKMAENHKGNITVQRYITVKRPPWLWLNAWWSTQRPCNYLKPRVLLLSSKIWQSLSLQSIISSAYCCWKTRLKANNMYRHLNQEGLVKSTHELIFSCPTTGPSDAQFDPFSSTPSSAHSQIIWDLSPIVQIQHFCWQTGPVCLSCGSVLSVNPRASQMHSLS